MIGLPSASVRLVEIVRVRSWGRVTAAGGGKPDHDVVGFSVGCVPDGDGIARNKGSQRVADHRDGDPEIACRFAPDLDGQRRPFVLDGGFHLRRPGDFRKRRGDLAGYLPQLVVTVAEYGKLERLGGRAGVRLADGNLETGNCRKPLANGFERFGRRDVAAVTGSELHRDDGLVETARAAGIDRRIDRIDIAECPQRRLDLSDLGRHVFQRCSLVCFQRNRYFALVGRRQEFGANLGHQHQARDKQGNHGADRRLAMPEGPVDQCPVPAGKPFEPAVEAQDQPAEWSATGILLRLRIVPDAGKHRIQRERNEQRDQHGDSHRHAKLQEKNGRSDRP